MIVRISPSQIRGTLTAPASKSSMQRACAAALLSKGVTTILRPGISNDDKAALDVISKLGAVIHSHTAEKLVIESDGVKPVAGTLNCGESGLGIRMFTPLAALSEKELVINGTGSLTTRPMHFFDEIFPKLGISIHSSQGHLPLVIQGPLVPADITIDGSLSSQFLTGLLMAFAAAGADGVAIQVKNLKSRPYIDLTLEVMRHFGIRVEHDNYEVFRFSRTTGISLPAAGEPASTGITFIPTTYRVEGDWSGGAFLLVAGAIAGEVTVKGLHPQSTQADKQILKALRDCGANLQVSEDEIVCRKASLQAFDFDATDCPDLFPPLVALAVYCAGVTTISGVSRLAHKESNRGLTLQEEFGKLGASIDLDGDIMRIHGNRKLKGSVVHSRHDHRIAMACAIAALSAEGDTTIEEANAVSKSYPDFYEDVRKLAASITF